MLFLWLLAAQPNSSICLVGQPQLCMLVPTASHYNTAITSCHHSLRFGKMLACMGHSLCTADCTALKHRTERRQGLRLKRDSLEMQQGLPQMDIHRWCLSGVPNSLGVMACAMLVQDCLANQDAACVGGILAPLLDIVAGGADKLAAKSAALAVAALVNDHTANQDAVRSVLARPVS